MSAQRKLTPVRVEVLMHYYYRSDALPSTPAYIEAASHLRCEGAWDGSELTPLGRAWVEAILRTPKPEVQVRDGLYAFRDAPHQPFGHPNAERYFMERRTGGNWRYHYVRKTSRGWEHDRTEPSVWGDEAAQRGEWVFVRPTPKAIKQKR